MAVTHDRCSMVMDKPATSQVLAGGGGLQTKLSS